MKRQDKQEFLLPIETQLTQLGKLFDFATEKKVLNTVVAMMWGDIEYIALDLLTDDDFTLDDTKILFDILSSLRSQGIAPNEANVLAQVIRLTEPQRSNVLKIVVDEQRYLYPRDFTEAVDRLNSMKLARRLVEANKAFYNAMLTGTPDDALDLLGAKYEALTANTVSKSIVSTKELLKASLSKLEEAIKNKGKVGIPSGINNLPSFFDDDFTVIAGRPGMGKTVAGLELTINASKAGRKVAFFSLEMPIVSLMNRIISGQVEDITYSQIRTGNVSLEDFARISKDYIADLSKLEIFWYDDDNRDIDHICRTIERMVRLNGCEMVIIDYLQLLQAKDYTKAYDVVSHVSKSLKRIQKKLEVPIIALAQLSREVEKRADKRPQLSDLRDSGQIEQDADNIYFLYRPDYYAYVSDKNHIPTYQFEIIIAKCRNGDTGIVECYIDVSTNRIRNNLADLNIKRQPRQIDSIKQEPEKDYSWVTSFPTLNEPNF